MKLFTKAIEKQLAKNGLATREAQTAGGAEPDHKPVLKIFNPTGAATWLITEQIPSEPDLLFGLCDLGMDSPELGYISRAELEGVRVRFGLKLERDLWFEADKPLSGYASEARAKGRIEA